MGCPFLPTPDLGRKKSLFFASVPRFWACCPHVFSFSFTSISCFSSWFLHIFPFFCQIFCLSKRKLADLGSNLLCFWWSSHANFAEFSDLYGWNYPARPPVRLKLSSTPSCMVEIIQYTLLYGWNYPARPSVWLKLPSTPFCMVEITQHALKGQKLLAQGNALGINDIQLTPCKGKSFTYRRGFSFFLLGVF